jgi:hypothetical protein
MSNIKEWHILLDQELNKVNSALYDILTPQEKDIAFNKNIEKFVKQRYGANSNAKQKGFEQSQKRIDDLRELVKINYSLTAYKPSFDDIDFNSMVKAELPSDYCLSINTRSQISYVDCGTFTYQEVPKNEYYSVLPVSSFVNSNWGTTRLKTFLYKNPDVYYLVSAAGPGAPGYNIFYMTTNLAAINWSVNDPIVFVTKGGTDSNIQIGTTYYIKTITSSSMTISASLVGGVAGPEFQLNGNLTNTTGIKNLSVDPSNVDVVIGTDLNMTNASNYTTEDNSYMTSVITDFLKNSWNGFSGTVNSVTYNYKSKDFEFYFERYKDLYFANSIIIVYKGSNSVIPTWSYSTNSGSTYTELTNNTYALTTYVLGGTNQTTSNKQVQEDDLFALQQDPFNATYYEFPLCFFSGNELNTYININDFVVNKTILSYIRKPKTVSYYLDINCDLPEFTHNEILSMTASYLLEEFEAGRYKTHQETVITNE